MIDISDLESRLNKTKKSAEKAKSSYESYTTEVARLETALSVFREMVGAQSTAIGASVTLNDRQHEIVNILKIGTNNSLSPAEIIKELNVKGQYNKSADYVRTTLWRLAKDGKIQNANGRYWRDESTAPIEDKSTQSSSSEEWPDNTALSRPFPDDENDDYIGFESLPDDLDSEVPF